MKPGQAGAAKPSASGSVEAELTELTYLEAWRFSPTRKQLWLYWSALPWLALVALLADPVDASLVKRLMPSLLVVALLTQEGSEARASWLSAVNHGLGFGLVTVRYDEVWLELESALVHYRLPWTELSGRVETPQSLLLYVKRGPWLLIPKWPCSDEDLHALRAHVPGAPSLPRFDPVRLCIGLLMVLVACWYVHNA